MFELTRGRGEACPSPEVPIICGEEAEIRSLPVQHRAEAAASNRGPRAATAARPREFLHDADGTIHINGFGPTIADRSIFRHGELFAHVNFKREQPSAVLPRAAYPCGRCADEQSICATTVHLSKVGHPHSQDDIAGLLE